MKIYRSSIVLACLLIGGTAYAEAGNVLFNNRKTTYSIVVSREASPSEQTAAQELQYYLYNIGNTEFPITNNLNAKGRKIVVGYNALTARLTGLKSAPQRMDEGFTYRNVGSDLVIYGGRERGTMYGVFSFLEREFGVHWFTSAYTQLFQRRAWSFGRLNHSERPAFSFRFSNYACTARDAVWSAHNRESGRSNLSVKYGNNVNAYWGCHSMGDFVNVKQLFDKHPEYFALVDGKRYSDLNSQPCMSNPEVFRLCEQGIIDQMRRDTTCLIYDVSQVDNARFCECEKCKAIENQYGGTHSGIMLWFVNRMADTIRQLFPNKYISTFAYQHSQAAPKNIKPKDNVVIRLAPIHCCYGHPYTNRCNEENSELMTDIEAWSKIAPRLFIWDYVVDFGQYMAPWPNFRTLGPDLQTYVDNNAMGVFDCADYNGVGGEFDEMKAWVRCRLMWNPKLDVDSLAHVFIFGYYGKSAPKIFQYYMLCQELINPDTHLGIYIKEDEYVYNDTFVRNGKEVLDDALKAAENTTIRERVERVKLQLLYLESARNSLLSAGNGTWAAFRKEVAHLQSVYAVSLPREDFYVAARVNEFMHPNDYISKFEGAKPELKVNTCYRYQFYSKEDSTALLFIAGTKGKALNTWEVRPADKSFQLINSQTTLALSEDNDGKLQQVKPDTKDGKQLWKIKAQDFKHFNIMNAETGHLVKLNRSADKPQGKLQAVTAAKEDSTAANYLWSITNK